MSEPVWICGLGMISALGPDVETSLHALEQNRSGVGTMKYLRSAHKDTLPVAEAPFDNQDLAEKAGLPAWTSRTALLSSIAAREAMAAAGLTGPGRFRHAFISANTVGGMDKTEQFFTGFLKNTAAGRLRSVVHHECGAITDLVANQLGFHYFVNTINTACSSSANAVMLAARLIRSGRLDIALAGGADALTAFTLNGFNALMILDKEPCRPFDQSRAGLNLGEGAGYLLLASEKAMLQLGATPIAKVSGWANATDAYHQTASSPEGTGSYAAMAGALKVAGLQTDAIDYINVHGTGTVNNDQSEGAALLRLFGEQCPPFSSTKAYTGHTLGASGGIEAVISALALREGVLFPNLRFSTPIEGFGRTPLVRLEKGRALRHVMSNSFGFGGNCTSLVFSKT